MRAFLIGAGISDGLGEDHEKPIQAVYYIRGRRSGLSLLPEIFHLSIERRCLGLSWRLSLSLNVL